MGITTAQGFLFSRALPPAEFSEMLADLDRRPVGGLSLPSTSSWPGLR
jgi:hypothetical protein